jgi:hypothetical protein
VYRTGEGLARWLSARYASSDRLSGVELMLDAGRGRDRFLPQEGQARRWGRWIRPKAEDGGGRSHQQTLRTTPPRGTPPNASLGGETVALRAPGGTDKKLAGRAVVSRQPSVVGLSVVGKHAAWDNAKRQGGSPTENRKPRTENRRAVPAPRSPPRPEPPTTRPFGRAGQSPQQSHGSLGGEPACSARWGDGHCSTVRSWVTRFHARSHVGVVGAPALDA